MTPEPDPGPLNEVITSFRILPAWKKLLFVLAGIGSVALTGAGFLAGNYLMTVGSFSYEIPLVVFIVILFCLPLIILIDMLVIQPVFHEERYDIIFGCGIVLSGLFVLQYPGNRDTFIFYLGFLVIIGVIMVVTRRDLRPLSSAERAAPMEEEVVLDLPYDKAFDRCTGAIENLNELFSFWKVDTADRDTGIVIGHEYLLGERGAWEVRLTIRKVSSARMNVRVQVSAEAWKNYKPLQYRRERIEGLRQIGTFLREGRRRQ